MQEASSARLRHIQWQSPRALKSDSAPPLKHQFSFSKMSGGTKGASKMRRKTVLGAGSVSMLLNETG